MEDSEQSVIQLVRHETVRLGTFPPGMPLAVILAKLGSVCVGHNTIRCAFCGRFYSHLDALDWSLHVPHWPGCSFQQLNIADTGDTSALCVG